MEVGQLLKIFLLTFCCTLVSARYEGVETEGKIQVAPPYFATIQKTDLYILPILQYGVHLLSPWIDSETCMNHYYGHHDIYRRKMNEVLKEWRAEEPDNEFAKESILHILMNLMDIPRKYFNRINNFGGGYVNHALYWATMSPHIDPEVPLRQPTGPLEQELIDTFGSVEKFKEEFTNKSLGLFGSGYVWLVRKGSPTGELIIYSSLNQDCPLSDKLWPLLVIDVWEHAYYVKHQYRRAKHIEDWWWLVDWESVQELSDFWQNDMKLSSFYDMPDVSNIGMKNLDIEAKVEAMLEAKEKNNSEDTEGVKKEEKTEL